MSTRPAVAVLGYHKIGDPPPGSWDTWYLVPTATFREHLALLEQDGWQVIDLATFHGALDTPEILPERSALITFDDGFQSMRGDALTVLREFGHPAVLFVPSDHVGSVNAFDADTAEPEEPLCAAADLASLAAASVSIQSHGASHRAFSTLDAAELANEVGRSKRALEAITGKAVDAIAYPYGDDGVDPAGLAVILRDAGYRSGFRYGGGPLTLPAPDHFALPRLAVGPDSDLAAMLHAVAR